MLSPSPYVTVADGSQAANAGRFLPRLGFGGSLLKAKAVRADVFTPDPVFS